MRINPNDNLPISELTVGNIYTLSSARFGDKKYVIDSIEKLSDSLYQVDMHEDGSEMWKYAGSGNYIFRNKWNFMNNKHISSGSVSCTYYFRKM